MVVCKRVLWSKSKAIERDIRQRIGVDPSRPQKTRQRASMAEMPGNRQFRGVGSSAESFWVGFDGGRSLGEGSHSVGQASGIPLNQAEFSIDP